MTTINVTYACIENGVQWSTCECPVANALDLALGGSWFVLVDECGIALAFDSVSGKQFFLPTEETERILHYDQTGEMEPHAFEVDLSCIA